MKGKKNTASHAQPNATPQGAAIVTVKLLSVKGSGGSKMKFVATVTGYGPDVHFGIDSPERYLCSAKYANAVSVVVSASESGPSDDTFETKTVDLGIDPLGDNPTPQSGTKDIVIKMNPEDDEDESATYTVSVKWFLTPSAIALSEFIANEMVTNAGSQTVADMKKKEDYYNSFGKNSWILLLSTEDPEWAVMKQFASLVGTGQVWDYKVNINKAFGSYAYDQENGNLYRFDIWGNVHYGYIGRAIGFSEELLLNAAGLAQAMSDGKSYSDISSHARAGTLYQMDAPEDQVAIRIGMNLWKAKGKNVTADDVIHGLRNNVGELKKANADAVHDAPEGTPPDKLVPDK